MKRAVIALAMVAIVTSGCALGTRPFVLAEHVEGFQSSTMSRCVLVDGPLRVSFKDGKPGKDTTLETWTFSVDHCTAAKLDSMELQVLTNARKPRNDSSWVSLGMVAKPEDGTTSDRKLRVDITKDWREELGTPLVVRYRYKMATGSTSWAVAQIGTQTQWLSPLILTGVAALVITGLTVGGN